MPKYENDGVGLDRPSGASPDAGDGPFGQVAEEYFRAGYSAIPLDGKAPKKIKNWSGYSVNPVSEKNQRNWLAKYPDHNIGITLGRPIDDDWRLAAIDIDRDEIVDAVSAVLDGPEVSKRGKKGRTFFVKAEKDLRSTSIKSKGLGHAIDILAVNKLTVIPPSIHPDTKQPYRWVGSALLDVEPSDLPAFTQNELDFLRVALEGEEASIIANGQGTHDPALSLTAKCVGLVPDQVLQNFICALLPNGYTGNLRDELPEMIRSAREKGFGQHSGQALPLDDRVALQVTAELAPIVFVPGDGFLKYGDGHWQKVSDWHFRQIARSAARPHLKPGHQLAAVLTNITRCAELEVYRESFGEYSPLICCQNGTVDVRTGELLAFSPDHELRYQLDIDFDPEATCPTYEEQLRTTFVGGEKAMNTFEEFAALTLIPEMGFQKALYLVGVAGSGKSTMLKVVEAMHNPDAVSVTPLDKIDNERYLTDLARKLVCISFDIQTTRKVFGEAFVRITGGDLVATRKLYAEVEGRVMPTVRFIGSMNLDMPRSIAAADALSRRLIMLECGEKVVKPDPTRFDKMMVERPGILARWVTAASRLLQRQRFDPPQSSFEIVDEYVNTQDPVQIFVQEALERDEKGKLTVNEILIAYNDWADVANEQRLSANVLGRKLRAVGFIGDFASVAFGAERKTVRVIRARWKSGREPLTPPTQ